MFLYLRVGFDGKIDQEVGQDCFESNFYETKNVESNRSDLNLPARIGLNRGVSKQKILTPNVLNFNVDD